MGTHGKTFWKMGSREREDHIMEFSRAYDGLGPLLANGFAGSQMPSDSVAPNASKVLDG